MSAITANAANQTRRVASRRYVVIGAGAIGVSLSAELDQAGHDVALIARGAQLAAARAGGITYARPDGTRTLGVPVHGGPEGLEVRTCASAERSPTAACRRLANARYMSACSYRVLCPLILSTFAPAGSHPSSYQEPSDVHAIFYAERSSPPSSRA